MSKINVSSRISSKKPAMVLDTATADAVVVTTSTTSSTSTSTMTTSTTKLASTSLVAVSINVSNATQLMTALQNAKGGERIVLKAGDYGNLDLSAANKIPPTYNSTVTITSADSGNPAKIAGLKCAGLSNLAFDHLTFKYDAPIGAPTYASPFTVRNCTSISFTNSNFIGDRAQSVSSIDDGYGTGNGLQVRDSSSVKVIGNSFVDFYRGCIFGGSSKLTVSGNDISRMASDGLDFTAVQDVLVQGNHLHTFVRNPASDAHPDMIQFWTAGKTTPSVNITIADNYLDQAGGQNTQSIFMRNEAVDSQGAGLSMYYQNVVIKNNVIVNSHLHGITVGETNKLLIDNNTILQRISSDEGKGTISVPRINVSALATGVTITDNVVPVSKIATQPGWIVSNNVMANRDDPGSAEFIGKLFSDALDRTNPNLSDYQVLPGSVLAVDGLGSSLTHSWLHLTNGKAAFVSGADVSSGGFMVHKFDANHVFDKNGKIDLTGAKVTWEFGDGTTGAGLMTDHVYAKPGNYEATATITLATNEVIKVDKTVVVRSSNLLDVDFDSSTADLSLLVNDSTNTGANLNVGRDGNALRLNGGTVKYQSTQDFFGNDAFTVLVDFKKDSATTSTGGRLIYFSGVFSITVGGDSLQADFSTTTGSRSIKVSSIGVNNSDWHKLALSFSSENGTASLFLDGKLVGSVSGLAGALQPGQSNSALYIGAPFGGSFVGLIDNLHYVADALSPKHLAAVDPLQAWAKDTISSNTAVADFASHTDAILPFGYHASQLDIQQVQ